jgi:cell division protein FtsW
MVALAVLVPQVLGVVMLHSAGQLGIDDVGAGEFSGAMARQLGWLAVGVGAGWIAAVTPLAAWRRMAAPAVAGALGLLLLGLALDPGSAEATGRDRWPVDALRSGAGEAAKIALVLGGAAWFGEGKWSRAVLAAVALVVPVLVRPDLGMAVVLAAMAWAMGHVAGASRREMAVGAVLTLAGLGGWFGFGPGFPDEVREAGPGWGAASPQDLALVALGSGGWEGLGLGAGRMKMLYMPSAHTDFVFPMIGEELGLPATLLVTACVGALAFAGLRISSRAGDGFGRALGVGAVVAVSGQGLLHVAAATGGWPGGGVPLPFVSSGGADLVASWVAVGWIANLAREGARPREVEPWWRQVPEVAG